MNCTCIGHSHAPGSDVIHLACTFAKCQCQGVFVDEAHEAQALIANRQMAAQLAHIAGEPFGLESLPDDEIAKDPEGARLRDQADPSGPDRMGAQTQDIPGRAGRAEYNAEGVPTGQNPDPKGEAEKHAENVAENEAEAAGEPAAEGDESPDMSDDEVFLDRTLGELVPDLATIEDEAQLDALEDAEKAGHNRVGALDAIAVRRGQLRG